MATQCLLVTMGAIETNANTKAIPTTRVDGNRPGRDFPGFTVRGHDEKRKVTNDKQSRSSRVRKSIVSGKSCHRTEVRIGTLCSNAVYSGTNSIPQNPSKVQGPDC